MFPKISKMVWIAFAICSVGIVYSQVPFAFNIPYSSSSQSASYTGPASSSVASSGTAAAYSGTGTSYASTSGSAVSSSGSVPASLPPIPEPNVELFGHSLKQLLGNSPVLNAVPDFTGADSYTLFLNVGRTLLQRQSGIDPTIAERAAEESRAVGVINKDLYFSAMSHMIAKMLYLNNLLTQETVRTYPRIILSYVERYGIENGITDEESVHKAVGNGIINFADSIGRLNTSNLTLGYQVFVQELKALASGAKI